MQKKRAGHTGLEKCDGFSRERGSQKEKICQAHKIGRVRGKTNNEQHPSKKGTWGGGDGGRKSFRKEGSEGVLSIGSRKQNLLQIIPGKRAK